VRDYDAIDPAYGTADDLKTTRGAAHQRGMKVFIDIVANHTAWDSVLIDKHPDWYTHDAAGQIVPPNPGLGRRRRSRLFTSRPARLHDGMMVRWAARLSARWFPLRLRGRRAARFLGVRARRTRSRPSGVVLLAEADDPALLQRAFEIDYAWDFYHSVSEAMPGRCRLAVRAGGKGRGDVSRGRLAPALLRQPRPAARHRQFGLPAALAASA
jgi:hypothetical protein